MQGEGRAALLSLAAAQAQLKAPAQLIWNPLWSRWSLSWLQMWPAQMPAPKLVDLNFRCNLPTIRERSDAW